MLETENLSYKIAKSLLDVEAVFLRPNNLFTWASGIKSPIYCDNRMTLSYPEVRTLVKDSFVEYIQANFTDVNCIAGVATAGIPQGALIADALGLPFIYVRSSNKDHGRGNLIEGRMPVDAKVIVIEDLISTGGSSIKAAKALEEHGAQILSLGAIFDYGLQKSINNFQEANINYFSLSTYDVLVDVALENNIVQENDVDFLKSWRQSL